MAGRSGKKGSWSLLTSHGHVLVEIARDPRARIRDLSAAAGITERATAAIITDLESAGYVTRRRVGRRNHYSVNLDLPFRHRDQSDLRVGPLLRLLTETPERRTDEDPASEPASDPTSHPAADDEAQGSPSKSEKQPV